MLKMTSFRKIQCTAQNSLNSQYELFDKEISAQTTAK